MNRNRAFALRLEMGFAMLRPDDDPPDLAEVERALIPDDAEGLGLVASEVLNWDTPPY